MDEGSEPDVQRIASPISLEVRSAMESEARRIEEDTEYSSKGHYEAASRWTHAHRWMGAPASIGAAAAGAYAFGGKEIVAGALAVVVAGLTAAMTFLDPSARANNHKIAGARYGALRNQARIFREVDLPDAGTRLDLRTRFRELAAERDALNETSPQIPRRSFELARAGIAAGEARHIVDISRGE